MSFAVLGTDALARRLVAAAVDDGRTVTLYGDPNAVVDVIEGLDAGGAIDGTSDLDAAVEGAGVVLDTRDHDDPQRALAAVEDAAPADATLLVTGDGSVTAAAAGCRDPSRVLGVFRLDATGEAIELVATEQTDDAVQSSAHALFDDLGIAVVEVTDVPGRIGRRLQLALEREAMLAIEDGVGTPAAVDRAMTVAYDHPIGPLARADRVGLEARLETFESLAEYLGDRFEPPDILRERVAAGQTGRAAGRGFYEYRDGERVTSGSEGADLP